MAGLQDSIDISQRDDVDKLKSNAVGLGGVLFACLAGAAPITAMLGNVPFAVGYGNGRGIPAAFIFATIVLTIFSVGYVAMARKITAVGGFYAFISHGLSRVLGVASGLVGAIAYMSIEAALIGGIGFFAQKTFEQRLGVVVPWTVFALISLVAICVLNYFDVDLSLKVLGVFLAAEVLILLVMDFGVLFQGAGETITGTFGSGADATTVTGGGSFDMSSLNVFKVFDDNGAGSAALGIFMAFWSWVGFEAAPNYAEESRDPVRNVPRATYISVVALGVFYTFTSWLVVSAWKGNDLIAAGNLNADFFYIPTTAYVGAFFTKAMSWLIITGSFACGMAFHNAATRYWYAMGREGLLPKALGKTHPKYKSAYTASTFQSVLALIIVVIYMIFGRVDGGTAQDYANNAAYVGLYTEGAVLATYLLLILQTFVSIAIPVYFTKHHPAERHVWKTLIAPIIATFAQLFVIFLLIKNLSDGQFDKKVGFLPWIPWFGIGVILAGIGIALYLRAAKPRVYEGLGRFVNTNSDAGVL